MATANSTRAAARTKPSKPYASFPLYAHASGKWAKKVKGRLYYFGQWDDPQAALREFNAWVETNRGRSSPTTSGGASPTISELVNAYLASADTRLAAGEIARRTFDSMLKSGRLLVEHFGRHRKVCDLHPLDFSKLRAEIGRRLNPVGVGNEITRCKTVFFWGAKQDLIAPVKFGTDFCRPPKATIRRHRRDNPRDMFTVDELRQLIKAAPVHLKAMILLGLNAGFNNGDCADLRLDEVDLDAAWISAPRKKTAVDRKCPLWPETVTALRESLTCRCEPRTPEARRRFFVRPLGAAYDQCHGDNAVTREFTALCRRLGVDRSGESFYTLRHHHSSWAQETGDLDACAIIMGHERDEIREGYRHHFPPTRLLLVTDHIREQLFGSRQHGGRDNG